MEQLKHLDRPLAEHLSIIRSEIDQAKRYPYVYAYPPKGAYRPFVDHAAVRRAWEGYAGPLSTYVHVPFCDIKCSFCTLFTTVGQPRERVARYVDCLVREFELVGTGMAGAAVTVESVYFGGGTPGVLTTDELGRVLSHISHAFTMVAGAEISAESTPDALDRAAMERLHGLGVNRLSFGVQSFVADELASMGRHYPAELSRAAPLTALDVGIPNVNVDLIFGIPGQQLDGWLANLRTAIDLGVPTITLYPLVVRDRTKYARLHRRAPEDFLDEAARQQWYEISVKVLRDAGFEAHSEVTFAKPGGGCRHEANEFRGLPTLGLGSGARSYAPTLHYTDDNYFRDRPNQHVIDDYLAAVESDRIAVASAVRLDEAERRLRYVILSLLHRGTVDADYRRMFGEPVDRYFGTWFTALETCGLAVRSVGVTTLTTMGRAHSAMIGALMTSPRMAALNRDYR